MYANIIVEHPAPIATNLATTLKIRSRLVKNPRNADEANKVTLINISKSGCTL